MNTTTTTLNNLIEILKDGQQGFTEAGRDVQSGDLKAVLSGFATQRDQFATQLQVLAKNFGEDAPARTGSVTGAVHRGWIHLKAAIASRDDHAILEECERGEDAAVAAYQDALALGDLPANVADVLRQQYGKIAAAHDQVKALRDARVVTKK
jgi:uncharacterized protein (TIGR02284 family)